MLISVGPSDLTAGTTEFNGGIIPTVTDNLARQVVLFLIHLACRGLSSHRVGHHLF
jgi:hypothetical protein